MFSIKKKLILLVSGCTLFATVLLGGISLVHLTRIINKDSQDTLQLKCRASKETLDIILGNIEQAVGTMKDIILSEIGGLERLSDAKECENFINQILLTNRTIVFHVKGCVAYYFLLNPYLVPAQQGYFWIYDSHYTRFLNQKIPDIAQFSEYDVEHAGRYYLPKKNGTATWILPYYDSNMGQEIISYAVPIYVRGTFVGVVGMDILHRLIADEVEDISLYKTGFAYLLDDQDRAIYHKDYDPGDLTFAYRSNSRSYTLELHNGWKLTTVASKWEINDQRRMLMFMLFFAMFVVAGVFIYISSRITNRIINPLMDLVTATRKLADGDLNAKLPVGSNDEVGILAKSFEETLRKLPNYLYRDSLTGVRNVSAYKRTVEELQRRMNGKEMFEYAVVVMDINNLKVINDKYGHEAGNDLITTSTSLICDVFKHSPVFRIGGDEFVAILEHGAYEERDSLVEQFKARLKRIAVFVEKLSLPVTVAIGLAVYDANTDKTYEEIFNRADEAMYENKKATKAEQNMPDRTE
ncbi:MAG: diguanylate cyclase [Treponema sp.]|nr:diguanylate cyclase [Treponema sp.]